MTSHAEPLRLENATLPDGRRADVHVAGGRIVEAAPDARAIDLGGALLAPAFVDGHIHLDKAFVGVGWRPHEPRADLAGRIDAERTALLEVDAELPIAERAAVLLRQIASYGTGFVRTHVDVHPEDGLRRLEAVLEARDRCREIADVEIVAFPQRGVLASPGTAELLDQALAAGADVVGGLDPATFDGDVEGQLRIVFDLAERHGAKVDMHLHDPGTLGTFELRRIAAHTTQRGLRGRVNVSHAYSLGMVDDDELARTADALAEAGVSILTNGPAAVAMPPVARLRAAGVRVFAGTDNIRDAWWPYGTGDMLERVYMIGHRQALYTDDELRLAFSLAGSAGAEILGLEDYGLQPGARANLVAIDAPSVPEAVAAPPRRLLVLHDGAVVM
ncbi:MAG TPA: amidohydrolase family protein [Solirubrobacter sp.]|nr:amidohydrolase family protein [Solirubrobacter sp.]